MDQQQDYQRLKEKLKDRWWRLNNLYYITDKQGNKIKFKPNWAQEKLYNSLHYFNLILKARQLGFTTFVMIYFLDACLFNSNHSAGVIAHTRDDAKKLFREKVKFAYNNLPEWLKQMRPATSDAAGVLEFSNNSSIYVGTSLRGGTLQKLLISEYGKISAKYPEKAKEIKTGALNTIEAGQQMFVESTAEGKVGEFFNLSEWARKLKDSGKILARLEPKFFFFGWADNPDYKATEEEIQNTTIDSETLDYFKDLEKKGIILNQAQKVWYFIKQGAQGEDMTQEYPSTPDEAFQGSLKGAYYSKSMATVRKRGQITTVPYDRRFPVITWWDLGLNDLMTVWFYQFINNRHHFIDYHESSEEGWDFYANLLVEKKYNYAFHGLPHDGNKRIRTDKGIVKDRQLAEQAGINPIKITPRTNNVHSDVVNVCAPILENCWFDEEKCAKGIHHLDSYRRRYSKSLEMFLKEPEHDEASHGSDSFRTFAVNADNIRTLLGSGVKKVNFQNVVSSGSYMGV